MTTDNSGMKIGTTWYVGLIPALVSGVFVYIVTRWYERDGFRDGIKTAWECTRNAEKYRKNSQTL